MTLHVIDDHTHLDAIYIHNENHHYQHYPSSRHPNHHERRFWWSNRTKVSLINHHIKKNLVLRFSLTDGRSVVEMGGLVQQHVRQDLHVLTLTHGIASACERDTHEKNGLRTRGQEESESTEQGV